MGVTGRCERARVSSKSLREEEILRCPVDVCDGRMAEGVESVRTLARDVGRTNAPQKEPFLPP